MSNFPNIKTITIVSASAGGFLVEILPTERLITADGRIMFHEIRHKVSGVFTTSQLNKEAAAQAEYSRKIHEFMAARLNISIEEYESKLAEGWWMTGADAVKNRAVDRVVSIRCSQELLQKPPIVINQQDFYSGSKWKDTYSACPALSKPIRTERK